MGWPMEAVKSLTSSILKIYGLGLKKNEPFFTRNRLVNSRSDLGFITASKTIQQSLALRKNACFSIFYLVKLAFLIRNSFTEDDCREGFGDDELQIDFVEKCHPSSPYKARPSDTVRGRYNIVSHCYQSTNRLKRHNESRTLGVLRIEVLLAKSSFLD